MSSLSVRFLGGCGYFISAGDTAILIDISEESLASGFFPEEAELADSAHIAALFTHPEAAHFAPEALSRLPERATRVFCYDMPPEYEGIRLTAGEEALTEGIQVVAFDSTGGGVSFLIRAEGYTFFAAGELNFWHWRDTSSIAEIEQAEKDFNRCLEPIPRQMIDIAFFPVDPRQGSLYDAGARAFVMTVKPRLLIPTLFGTRVDAARRFALTAETSQTKIQVLEKAGETLVLQSERTESKEEDKKDRQNHNEEMQIGA